MRKFLILCCLLGSVSVMPATAENSAGGELLAQLNLNDTQKSAIQAVLLGGMQSLNAISSEIQALDSGSAEDAEAVIHMRRALIEQRMRLAEELAVEILGVLTQEQLSKLDFGALLGAMPANGQSSPAIVSREIEI